MLMERIVMVGTIALIDRRTCTVGHLLLFLFLFLLQLICPVLITVVVLTVVLSLMEYSSASVPLALF